MTNTHTLFLLIGGNQGDRAALLQQATDLIHNRIGSVVSLSKIYSTAPWGQFKPGEEPQDFLNCALKVATSLTPFEALSAALAIEKELGRTRPTNDKSTSSQSQRLYSSRPIDIDLILYDTLTLDTHDLTLPHPRMQLRRFVLQPLCDIAPDYIHPILNKPLIQLLKECPDSSPCVCYC